MKIGILTLPINTNIGGILQAYALQVVLSMKGHQVEVLNRYKDTDRPQKDICGFFHALAKHIYRSIIKRILYGKNSGYYWFIKRYLNLSVPIYSPKELKEYVLSKHYETIVVGSDQVWRQWYKIPGFTSSYFLDVLYNQEKINKIAYAASFGFDKCNIDFELDSCKRGISSFKAVSVREASGVGICSNVFQIPAQQVLDPTMLLLVDNYSSLIEENDTKQSPGELFCYILDNKPEYHRFIEKVRNWKNYTPYNYLQYWGKRESVAQWLRAFSDAKFVITDSFHGCVFSILFNKPFIVLGNSYRGQSRFESLLSLFGLTDRMVTKDNFEELNNLLNHNINWNVVNEKLAVERQKSLEFLYKNI